MNPELRRQLWLQLSPTRLLLAPVLLALIFTAVYLSARSYPLQAVVNVGLLSFGILVWGMGSLAAAASVIDEMTDRTWDQQRMSAMQPWAMTWGKLLGASSYAWYGGVLCLLVIVPCALGFESAPLVFQLAVLGPLVGLLLQAAAIAVNLQLVNEGGKILRRSSSLMMLLMALWGGSLVFFNLPYRQQPLMWWGWQFEGLSFCLWSLALFCGCALVAAWRSMAEVLAVRQLPWAWPALALLSAGYLTGFVPEPSWSIFGLMGLCLCLPLTYVALLAEPQQRPVWQRVLGCWQRRQWLVLLLQLPKWPTTLALALVCALLVQTSVVDAGNQALRALGLPLQLTPLVLVVLLARDCALALFFSFVSKGRRPVLAFMVLMLVLYGLLPWLAGVLQNGVLLDLILPVAGGAASLVIAFGHLLIAGGLLYWRWRNTATG